MGNLVDTSKEKYIKDILYKHFKENRDILKFIREHGLNENDLLNEQKLKNKIEKLKGKIKDISCKIKDKILRGFSKTVMGITKPNYYIYYEYYMGNEKIDKSLYDRYLKQNSRIQSDIKILEEIIKGLEEWNKMFSGYIDFSNDKTWPKGELKAFIIYCMRDKSIKKWIKDGIDENKDKILTKAKEIKPNFEKKRTQKNARY